MDSSNLARMSLVQCQEWRYLFLVVTTEERINSSKVFNMESSGQEDWIGPCGLTAGIGETTAYIRKLSYNTDGADRLYLDRAYGFSVRCVKE